MYKEGNGRKGKEEEGQARERKWNERNMRKERKGY